MVSNSHGAYECLCHGYVNHEPSIFYILDLSMEVFLDDILVYLYMVKEHF